MTDPIIASLVTQVSALEDQMGRMVARTLVTVTADNVPIGAILPFGGSTPPSGYLLCDGTSYAASAYPQLSAALGYTYGGSGGSFNVPDCRGKVLVGYKSGDANFGTLGASVGEAAHVMSVAEMPAHGHQGAYGANAGSGSYTGYCPSGITSLVNYQHYLSGDPGTAQSTGGGGAHNNVQPSLIVNAIIRAA